MICNYYSWDDERSNAIDDSNPIKLSKNHVIINSEPIYYWRFKWEFLIYAKKKLLLFFSLHVRIFRCKIHKDGRDFENVLFGGIFFDYSLTKLDWWKFSWEFRYFIENENCIFQIYFKNYASFFLSNKSVICNNNFCENLKKSKAKFFFFFQRK